MTTETVKVISGPVTKITFPQDKNGNVFAAVTITQPNLEYPTTARAFGEELVEEIHTLSEGMVVGLRITETPAPNGKGHYRDILALVPAQDSPGTPPARVPQNEHSTPQRASGGYVSDRDRQESIEGQVQGKIASDKAIAALKGAVDLASNGMLVPEDGESTESRTLIAADAFYSWLAARPLETVDDDYLPPEAL
jgi:hypothetical protein